MKSWIDVDKQSDFSIYNIPFGICQIGEYTFVASRIGDQVIDLSKVANQGTFDHLGIQEGVLNARYLNDFISQGKAVTNGVRTALQKQLSDTNSILNKDKSPFSHIADVQVLLPVDIRDYTDFYSSIEHATNVGKMFRDPENALLPNWRHIPVGYHGRASSILVSGKDIHRPTGQTKPADGPPEFGPSQRLDFELEMGFIIGKPTDVGCRISTAEAESHIFGLALFNDWSARDIQKWEYVPLGPFLGKNFASSLGAWIVTMEALEPFKVAGPVQDPAVLPYLEYRGERNYDIKLEVSILTPDGSEKIVSKSNFKYMYWNMMQQLAHHTVNGCNVNVGDLMASGTISGKDESSYGSMLEISWAGKKPVEMPDGTYRKFINDGDTVIMRGYAQKGEMRVGLGEVRTKVLPVKN